MPTPVNLVVRNIKEIEVLSLEMMVPKNVASATLLRLGLSFMPLDAIKMAVNQRVKTVAKKLKCTG